MDPRTRIDFFRSILERHLNAALFVGGFLFDLLTIGRIDGWLDLSVQACYLACIGAILVLDARAEAGLWTPRGSLAAAWRYGTEALHFLYGGLFSAYLIFYSRSSGSRTWIFLAVVGGLMLANELPPVRRAGRHVRMGFFCFCLASFFNYLLPVLLGRMGTGVFLSALAASAIVCAAATWGVTRTAPEPRRDAALLARAPAGVLALVGILYAARWIPPVPLSVQYAGIFHNVESSGQGYVLTYERPPWRLFWRREDAVFKAGAGDRIHCFVRVFAPTRFQHQVFLHWRFLDEAAGRYATSDRIPLDVRGGRDLGYRGYAVKSNYRPGRWRVEVETSDGRIIGGTAFRVEPADASSARQWATRRM